MRRGGFYYLFASFDFCCRGVNSDYRVMVGRSRSITGPYVDRSGVPMLEGGGTELLRGYNEFAGPGHGDVYRDRGVDWFAHHYYDRDDPDATPRLSVRAIDWRGGWPRLGDPLSGSREPGRGPAFHEIVNRNSGALLDNPTCGYEGADIRLGADRDSPCARWRIEDRGDGWASLNNEQSNKVAEAAGCATANGADVAQWGWLNNDCQRFRFVAHRRRLRRGSRTSAAGACSTRRAAAAPARTCSCGTGWATPASSSGSSPPGTSCSSGSTSAAAGGPCRWDFRHTRARLLDRDRAPQRPRARRAARRARARRAARARARGAVEPDAAQRRHVHARQPRGRR